MNESLTIDEFLAEISAAVRQDEGRTLIEWAETLGWGEEKARRTIRKLMAAGKMAHGKAPRMSMNGVSRMSDVYRIL